MYHRWQLGAFHGKLDKCPSLSSQSKPSSTYGLFKRVLAWLRST